MDPVGISDAELKSLKKRYTIEPGWVPGVESGRHRNAAGEALGQVYRHKLGECPNRTHDGCALGGVTGGAYPEIGVVEASGAAEALASAYSERDEYKAAIVDVLKLVEEVKRLKKAMRKCMSDMPSDQSRGYETLSLALGEP